MRSSKLDRVIIIQKAISAKDDFNNDVETPWFDFLRTRASKQEVRDSERIAAQEVGADIDIRFQVRWSSKVAQINPKDRLIFEGRTFRIIGIKELGRRIGREISATARLDDATV